MGKESVVYFPQKILNSGERSRIEIGHHTHIRGELFTFPGGRISIGSFCYLGEHSRIWAATKMCVGDRVLIAHSVTILDSLTHPVDAAERHAQYRAIISTGHPEFVNIDPKPIAIEDDAWIGCNVVVLRGVRIGAGAIIGAGSIVTRDVPAGSVVAGNPARAISRT
jgi:acetyltransferase-like isoleucine patch superfamily enzyme